MNKVTWIILSSEILFSIIISLVFTGGVINNPFFTVFGLCNLVLGLFGFFVALVIVFFDRELAKPVFLSSGIILLAGCLTCSIFPWE
ncbi:MAG TPA: hypothetical protein VNM35_02790 [Chitinophagaceae bacterium]|jgi:hypothetical protein|nr:hypothetical protein [Chitinophagaceae bacterium]